MLNNRRRILLTLLSLILLSAFTTHFFFPNLLSAVISSTDYQDGKKRAAAVAEKVTPTLKEDLKQMNLSFGAPVFLRAFKEERQLEVWIQEDGKQTFKLFRSYPIAGLSGKLGPKKAEGDRQVPEGFYFVNASQLHPASRFHLAFNIGYPNAYDRAHQRTGSFIMVHGNTASIGCYAMTDEKIEEIYTLCAEALKNGQSFFRFHTFPFHMTNERLQREKNSPWYGFWKNLQEGYKSFENGKRPPNVTVKEKRYRFSH